MPNEAWLRFKERDYFTHHELLVQEIVIMVTVQFETEGNSQNEIFIHMDRSEVKP